MSKKGTCDFPFSIHLLPEWDVPSSAQKMSVGFQMPSYNLTDFGFELLSLQPSTSARIPWTVWEWSLWGNCLVLVGSGTITTNGREIYQLSYTLRYDKGLFQMARVEIEKPSKVRKFTYSERWVPAMVDCRRMDLWKIHMFLLGNSLWFPVWFFFWNG